MSQISSKHTLPEVLVRKALYNLGCRYRLHDKNLSGKPDIVIRKSKTAVFVNGCFWHQHKGCKRQSVPKSNLNYWKDKLKSNVKKQKKDIRELRKNGWSIFIIWECETKKPRELLDKIERVYEKVKSI